MRMLIQIEKKRVNESKKSTAKDFASSKYVLCTGVSPNATWMLLFACKLGVSWVDFNIFLFFDFQLDKRFLTSYSYFYFRKSVSRQRQRKTNPKCIREWKNLSLGCRYFDLLKMNSVFFFKEIIFLISFSFACWCCCWKENSIVRLLRSILYKDCNVSVNIKWSLKLCSVWCSTKCEEVISIF